ncbi:MAG: M1 family peptidase, partial [Planctomycetes bacterium]|nr:M1 family peptidase [Planctomycetota bacterium]
MIHRTALGIVLLGMSLAAQTNVSGGPLEAEQAAYDVQHYRLELSVDPQAKAIEGLLTVRAKLLQPLRVLALDLDSPLVLRAASMGGKSLKFERKGGRIRIDLAAEHPAGSTIEVEVAYGGQPRVASNPPWEGGFTWAKTPEGMPWIATSCQGLGADAWWPCKDHPSDEPETMDLLIRVPKPLVVASNGVLESVEEQGESRVFHWSIKN